MAPPVDDQAAFPSFAGLMRHDSPEQTRPDDKKIIFIHTGF
jgi:hypothetical protein